MNHTQLSDMGLFALISITIASLTGFLAESVTGTSATILVCLTLAVSAIAVYAIARLVKAGDAEQQHYGDMQVRYMGK